MVISNILFSKDLLSVRYEYCDAAQERQAGYQTIHFSGMEGSQPPLGLVRLKASKLRKLGHTEHFGSSLTGSLVVDPLLCILVC